MDPDLIMEAMFNWKYIWWVILFSYVLVSEVIYFFSCKYNTDETGWFEMKFFSFGLGIMGTLLIICIVPLVIVLGHEIITNPTGCLKVIAIIVSILLGIFLFFFANYKIWEKYN
jgi:hypothetical protein